MGRWTAADIPDQAGRTFVVTGANSGLGYATTAALAAHGAHVVLAVRHEGRGRAAVDRLRAAHPEASVELRRLDLADLASVRAFARQILDDGVAVDVLVNNAGIMMPPRSLTVDGFESQFGANHLGHFALTGLLWDRIRASRDARVVTVSSTLHRGASIRFDDLTGARRYSRIGFYGQSKLANVLFGLELDRRLRAAGLPIRSLLAHPGYAATNLQTAGWGGAVGVAMRIGNLLFAQSAATGALPQLCAATSPAVASGQFIGPDRLGGMRGHPTVVRPDPAATDRRTARALWDVSEQLTGVHWDLPAAP